MWSLSLSQYANCKRGRGRVCPSHSGGVGTLDPGILAWGGRARTRSHKSHRPTVQLVLGSSVWVTGRCLGTASHYRSQGEVCEVPGRDTPLRFCFHPMLRLEV